MPDLPCALLLRNCNVLPSAPSVMTTPAGLPPAGSSVKAARRCTGAVVPVMVTCLRVVGISPSLPALRPQRARRARPSRHAAGSARVASRRACRVVEVVGDVLTQASEVAGPDQPSGDPAPLDTLVVDRGAGRDRQHVVDDAQAPQEESSQPRLEPVRSRSSRKTSSSVRRGSVSRRRAPWRSSADGKRRSPPTSGRRSALWIQAS